MKANVLATILVLTSLLAATSPANATAYTFTQIDVPGIPDGTGARDINDSGQIVGSDNIHSGFLYSGGSFSTLDAPGATFTLPLGINNTGQIVGAFRDGTGGHSFLYTMGSFSNFEVPGGRPNLTAAHDINDAGQIVGTFSPADGTGHGFLYSSGSVALTGHQRCGADRRVLRALPSRKQKVFCTPEAASPLSMLPLIFHDG